MKKWQSSLFLRYAVSYLLVVALPFLAFSAFFNVYFNQTIRRDIREGTQRMLGQVMRDFDLRVAQMHAIGGQVSLAKPFQTRLLQQNYEAYHSVRNTLTGYLSTNLFFNELVFYHTALPEIYFSTQGTYQKDYYRQFLDETGRARPLSYVDESAWQSHWITSAQLVPGRVAADDCLLYVQAVSHAPDSYLFFELTEERIRAQILTQLPEGAAVYIVSGDTQLYPFGSDDVWADHWRGATGDTPIRLPDKRYIDTMVSAQTGLTYGYITPEDAVLGTVKRAMRTYLGLLFLLSVVCGIAACGAALRQSRPVQGLITLADDISGTPKEAGGIGRVRLAMLHWKTQSEKLDALLCRQRQEHAMIRLVRGKYENEADAAMHFAHLDMMLRRPYRCILLLIQSAEASDTEENLLDMVREGMGAQHTVYGFSYDAHNRCVLLLDMETPDMERLRARIEVLCKTLSRDGRIYRAACSAPFQGLTQASGAYLQALSAGRAAPGEPMIRFVQGDTVHDGFFYPHHELSALLDAIRKQQREQAVFLYDVLRKLAWMHRDNELLTISLLTDLINLSLSAWAELNVAAGEKEPDDTQPAQEQRFHDIDDMFAYSDTLHTQVMRLLVAHTLTSPQMDMMAVASYISATEEMETMTAGAIAERFGMTASVLSRRFKEQMGCNISDYISTRKTSFACTLLRTTTMTVTEIAQRLGYMQYSSFVRQFKQQKGVTPTAYRESIREP